MLKVEINKGETSIEVCGSCVDICADVSFLIKIIYDRLEGDAKEFFAEGLKDYVGNEMFKKSGDELCEETEKRQKEQEKKKKEKAKEDLKKTLDGAPTELLDMLKELLQ